MQNQFTITQFWCKNTWCPSSRHLTISRALTWYLVCTAQLFQHIIKKVMLQASISLFRLGSSRSDSSSAAANFLFPAKNLLTLTIQWTLIFSFNIQQKSPNSLCNLSSNLGLPAEFYSLWQVRNLKKKLPVESNSDLKRTNMD